MTENTYTYRHKDFGKKMLILIDAQKKQDAYIYLIATVQDPLKWELEGVY